MNQLVSKLAHADKIEKMLIESGGEITEEIQRELSVNSVPLSELVDSKYLTLERLEMAEQYFEKKEQEFKQIRLSLKNAQSFVKESIKSFMIEKNIDFISGSEYQFKLSKSKPSVEIVNEDEIFQTYKKQKTTTVVDKETIYEDLKKGIPVQGAVLKETYTLRKTIKKGE